ncbi:MAG: family 78 glycoside hydrolase catalytic domain [Clostridia bacterium]|nr:family 78 glycoside hydrolase catalytic domain [Clostridia bacterium]
MNDKISTHEFLGKWISNSLFAERKPINVFHRQLETHEISEENNLNCHIIFRKTFEIEDFKKAWIYISADDYYKLYINGLPVTMGPCPGYPEHYYYDTVDVTDYLLEGENTIAVHTYYQGLINRVWVSGDGRQGLLLDLCLDGKTVLSSDETFLVHDHTAYKTIDITGYSTQILETYDSNASEIDFESPWFDDSEWENAKICEFDDHVMFPCPSKQVEISPIKPVILKKQNDGYFVDFGKTYVGTLFLAASGKKNGKIQMFYGCELDENGEVRYKLRANCTYMDDWILSGGDDCLNQFDYKAFRYVKIIVPEGATIETADVRLLARHYPFELSATPNTSDPQLLKIWELCVHTLKFGVQETIMDCVEREKGQYVGDGVYTATTYSILSGDTTLLEKLLDDALRSSFINRGLTTCTTCSFMQEIAEFPLMLGWLLVVHYHLKKDKQFIADRIDKFIDVLEFYHENYERNEEGFLYDLDKWCVVDWPKAARDGYDYEIIENEITKGTHNVICAYYIAAVKTVNLLCSILERPYYRNESLLVENFINAFYDSDKKIFRDSKLSEHISLPSNVLPLLFGLCPDKECEQNILNLIIEKGIDKVNIFMCFPMLAALKGHGADKELIKQLKNPDAWLNMLEEGATTTFEAFGKDKKWNTSLFHLTFSYAAQFLTDWNMEKLLNGDIR